MKTKIMITLMAVVLYIFTFFPADTLFGQTTDKYVRIADTTVNLADVDLEKGLVLEKVESKEIIKGEYLDNEKKIYKDYDNQYYMVVQDSGFYSGYSGVYKSRFSYFKSDGTKIFSKQFERLNTGRVFIMKGGNKVFVELGSEDEIKFILYDIKGDILKEIDNQEVFILTDNKNETIYIQPDGNNDELQIINSNIDQIKILKFPDRVWLKNFSPDGKFFTARCLDSLMVYNRYGDFQWGLKYKKQNIYVFANGRKYFEEYPFPIGIMEIKETDTHKTLYVIDGVYFKDKKYPIYKSGVVANSEIIWVSYYVDKLQVFNFINEKGQIINDYTLPSNIYTHEISFNKEQGKYIAIVKAHEQ